MHAQQALGATNAKTSPAMVLQYQTVRPVALQQMGAVRFAKTPTDWLQGLTHARHVLMVGLVGSAFQ